MITRERLCRDEEVTTKDAVLQFAEGGKTRLIKYYTDHGIYHTNTDGAPDLNQVLQDADVVTKIPLIVYNSHVTWIVRAYQQDRIIELDVKRNMQRRSGCR